MNIIITKFSRIRVSHIRNKFHMLWGVVSTFKIDVNECYSYKTKHVILELKHVF